MLKTLIFILIFGVIIHGALGDVDCFLRRQNESLRQLKDGFDYSLIDCRPMKLYWDSTRNDTKVCSTKKIDITKAEAFTKDLCTIGWDLNKRFHENKDCFIKQAMAKEGNCLNDLVLEVRSIIKNETELRKIGEGVCKKMLVNFENQCFENQLGEPCGDDGAKLVKEMTAALASFTTGVCLEIGGASTMTALSWTTLLAILLLTMWHKDD